ncbi:hypothetical protein Ocin01_18199 [Orchesella cincta]|uniref:Uncharacterized protein n=1 Tax=Orchesella cincta TaxID=48709 RepID=A0A1D2M693_ORCCI|nr:hypothetical protein Ocin01_18199 [Orchesella cincta]
MTVMEQLTNSVTKWPKCVKTYNPNWEKDPILKTWINRHPSDNGKVLCRFCNSIIRAHKNDLIEHTRTRKHERNFKQQAPPDAFNKFLEDLQGLKKTPAMAKRFANSKQPSPTSLPLQEDSVTQLKYEPGTACFMESGDETNGSTGSRTPDENVICIPSLSLNCDIGEPEQSIMEEVLCDDDLWSHEGEEFNISAESPSDLVSVILEEQQSPQSNSSTPCLVPSPTTSIIASVSPNDSRTLQTIEVLAHGIHSLEGVNFTLVGGATLASPQLVSASNSSNFITTTQSSETIPFVSVTTQDIPVALETVNGSIALDAKRAGPSLKLKDVISAIESGVFSLPELCSLAKMALNKVEENVSGKEPSKISTIGRSSNCNGTIQEIPVSLAFACGDSMESFEHATIKTERSDKKRRLELITTASSAGTPN